MNNRVVRVIGAADGSPTPHDGKFVVSWNPHTVAGTLELSSTAYIERAKRFSAAEAMREWQMVSRVQPRRPWDGEINRPLCGVTVEVIEVT